MGPLSSRHLAAPITHSMMLRILLAIVLLCITPAMAIPSQPVIIDGGEFTMNLSAHLDYFVDTSDIVSIKQITSGTIAWTGNEGNGVNHGYPTSAYWFCLRFNNITAREIPLYIEIDKSNLDYIDYYKPRRDNSFDALKTGDMRHFSTRDVPDRNFVFFITVKPGPSEQYFRVKTGSTMRFQVFLYTPSLFHSHRSADLAILWLFLGMLFLTVIYNIFILAFTGNRTYLLLALFSISIFMYLISQRGIASQFLWPGALWWNSRSVPFFNGLMCVTGTLFVRNALETGKAMPLLHRTLGITGLGGGAVVTVLSFLMEISTLNIFFYALIIVVLMLYIAAMITGIMLKNRYAAFLALGFLLFFISIPYYITLNMGWIPMTTLAEFSFDIAILWLVVFSSLGLADRINVMRKEVQAGREQLQLAIDGSNDGIWDYTPGSDRIFLSDRCFTMLGYDPGDLPKTIVSVLSLIHPDDRKNFESTFDLGTGSAVERITVEFRMRAKEGGWRWIVARGKVALENSTRKAFRITGTNSDVTETREALEALKKSEEKFYTLFKNSPDIVSVNTVPDLIYQDANDRFFELLGYSRNEVIGHSIQELKIAAIEHIEAMGAILLAQGNLKNQEVPFFTRAGEKRLGLLTVDTIKIGDKPHFVIIMNDITESREIERELMNIVGDERRRIGQDLHDDLGQTLTGVAFLIQTLRQEVKGHPGTAEKTIGRIGDLVMNAIMKVRTISKMLSPVEMESRGFITAIEEMVANIQEVFLISCEVLYDGDVEIRDTTTASNLYYIAREAVNNAIKHGKADEIVIRFAVSEIALVMSITDNGAGMDMNRPAGGIGLKTIDYRARIIGATARIEGLERGGTRVSITLPL